MVLAAVLISLAPPAVDSIFSSQCAVHIESLQILLLCLLGAAIKKCHRLGGLNNRSLFPHNSGGWESKIKVPAGLASPASSPQLVGATLVLTLHMWLTLWAHNSLASLPVFIKTPVI